LEQTLALSNGAVTQLESWGSKGPAVICVHGITSSRKSWRRTAESLQDRFRVFAYDQRGHGDSAETFDDMSLQRSLDDLRAVAASVGEPCALIGHSWGGAVALLGGREDFATKVVAVDPMIVVERGSWEREYLDDAEADLSLPWEQRERMLRERHREWDPSDVDGKLHAVRRMKAESIRRLGEQNQVDEGGWDLRATVSEYPKPLLILAAAPGESAMSEEDLTYVRAQGGPKITIETYTDQGHNLHRTAFPRFIKAAEAFLTRP
jgi:pimeloyl-ACP methyl ester carboxylesterase